MATAILLLTAAALLAVQTEETDASSSGECGDDLTWILDDDNLSITGTGTMDGYFYDDSTEGTTARTVSIGDSVTTIGKIAFYGCSSLEKIDLGASLKRIGAKSFASCPAVSEINIPQTLSRIGSDAFDDLTFLDANGNELSKTAEALRGLSFVGADGVLQATS